ncbi:MAG: transporter, partial [Robiginitalea sp.]
NQGIKSDRYADVLLRTGVAYLLSDNFQADLLFGGSFKDTPSRGFIAGGISYRLDRHTDKLKPIEDQEPQIGRKEMRKKKKESGKSKKKKGKEPEQEPSEIDW